MESLFAQGGAAQAFHEKPGEGGGLSQEHGAGDGNCASQRVAAEWREQKPCIEPRVLVRASGAAVVKSPGATAIVEVLQHESAHRKRMAVLHHRGGLVANRQSRRIPSRAEIAVLAAGDAPAPVDSADAL